MAKEIEAKLIENSEVTKKTCFLITPIDSIDSDTRRHIDGLIDEVIIPILDDLNFETNSIVAHRDYTTGLIVKGIIEKICESDLVIANLTKLNPNVMYELALRHALGKATIMIAENGTKLPFDTNEQRTIFYRNDFQGAFQLKEELRNAISCINFDKEIFDNPITNSIKTINIEKSLKIEGGSNDLKAFDYIINRLDIIENKLQYQDFKSNSRVMPRMASELSLGMREEPFYTDAEFIFRKVGTLGESGKRSNIEIVRLMQLLIQRRYVLEHKLIDEGEVLIVHALIDNSKIEQIIERIKTFNFNFYEFIDYRVAG